MAPSSTGIPPSNYPEPPTRRGSPVLSTRPIMSDTTVRLTRLQLQRRLTVSSRSQADGTVVTDSLLSFVDDQGTRRADLLLGIQGFSPPASPTSTTHDPSREHLKNEIDGMAEEAEERKRKARANRALKRLSGSGPIRSPPLSTTGQRSSRSPPSSGAGHIASSSSKSKKGTHK
ncbi:hypothetical protein G7046_g9100 [Stylonectria norvegica]|nr:hypothetical protein G7046_g9100 [Stylonectria norvegica]